MFGLHLARRGNIVVVVDVGGASAAVAIARITKGKPAEVLASERVTLPLEAREKAAQISALEQTIEEAATKTLHTYAASSKHPAPIAALYCVVRAPWSSSRSVRAAASYEKPVVVTDELVASLAKQALAQESELDRGSLLEAAVMQVEINGYKTTEPEKKRASELAVSVLVSDCDADAMKTIRASLQQTFPHVRPTWRSSTRALLTAIRTLPEHESDFVAVEIGTESAAITAIRGGAVAQQRVVAEGVRGVLERLAGGKTPEETLTLIRMLERDECSDAACEELQAAMGKAEPELVRTFGEAMAACATPRRLPNNLVLVGHPDLLPWLSKFFARIDFTQFTTTTQPFTVRALGPKDFAEQVHATGRVAPDAGLSLSLALVALEIARP